MSENNAVLVQKVKDFFKAAAIPPYINQRGEFDDRAQSRAGFLWKDISPLLVPQEHQDVCAAWSASAHDGSGRHDLRRFGSRIVARLEKGLEIN